MIIYDISGCLVNVVGDNGLILMEYDKWFERVSNGVKQFKIVYEVELLFLFRIVECCDDIEILIEKFYFFIEGNDSVGEVDIVVFLGIGGFSFGG